MYGVWLAARCLETFSDSLDYVSRISSTHLYQECSRRCSEDIHEGSWTPLGSIEAAVMHSFSKVSRSSLKDFASMHTSLKPKTLNPKPNSG